MTTPSKPFNIDKKDVYETYRRVASSGSKAATTETGPWPLPTKASRRSNSCWRSTTGSGHQSPDTGAAVLTG